MATTLQAPGSDRLVPKRVLRGARFYAPQRVRDMLHGLACEPELALAVDVDALERTTRARVDRVMLLALDALVRSGVQIVVIMRDEIERATVLHRNLIGSCLIANVDTLERVQLVTRGSLIAITDDRALLSTLRDHDRGIAVGGEDQLSAGITVAGDASLRAALWWLVEMRSTSHTAARP